MTLGTQNLEDGVTFSLSGVFILKSAISDLGSGPIEFPRILAFAISFHAVIFLMRVGRDSREG